MTARPVRVLISYAHGGQDDDDLVRQFWTILRREGIDARIDLTAAAERQFWPRWMNEQIQAADYVLVVVSPRYKALTEAADVVGLGVPWEARQLQELLYARFGEGLRRVVPVVLPGYGPEDIPHWLYPAGGTSYAIAELTSEGIDALMRMLTAQPLYLDVPIGEVRVRPAVPLANPTTGVPHEQGVEPDQVNKSPRIAFDDAEDAVHLGDFARAEAGYRRSIILGGNEYSSKARLALGILLENWGDYVGAKENYGEVIDLHEDDFYSHAAFRLGRVLALENNLAASKKAYEQAIASGHPYWAPEAEKGLGALLGLD